MTIPRALPTFFACSLAATPALAACFTAADAPTIQVWEQGPPPLVDSKPGYNFYPATVAATVQVDKLRASHAHVQGAYWQWANHGPPRQ